MKAGRIAEKLMDVCRKYGNKEVICIIVNSRGIVIKTAGGEVINEPETEGK